jgi:cell division protein FtsA
MRSSIIVGLDVGTTKVCAVAAERYAEGVRILGTGMSQSQGLRKGMVINIDETADSIRRAVKAVESSAGIKAGSVSVGISGGHIKEFSSSGAVGIRGKEVSRADIERALDSAKAVYMPLDREVLHVIPTEFNLDGQGGITDPCGMSGVRLEARVSIITGAASSIQNLIRCCEKAGLAVSDTLFTALASAVSLESDEKKFGVFLIDIGGGTTDIVFFKDGKMRRASVLSIGGNHITSDIAVGFRITLPEAEKLKKQSGAAHSGAAEESEEITLIYSGGEEKKIPRKYLTEIVQPRCEEMLELIKEEINSCSGYSTAVCGVVLTGGSSLLRGFDNMAESTLGLPTRVGYPRRIDGMAPSVESPEYSAAIGLISFGSEPDMNGVFSPYNLLKEFFDGTKSRFRSLLGYANDIITRKEGGMLCLKSKK